MNKQNDCSDGSHISKLNALQNKHQAFHSELPDFIVDSAKEFRHISAASLSRMLTASCGSAGEVHPKYDEVREQSMVPAKEFHADMGEGGQDGEKCV